MGDEHIKIATSVPGLKNKIQVKVDEGSDAVHWYIRFNIPLDESTVSEKNMDVTDTDGYIMRTTISYDKERNLILISPLESYEQDRFYLLNIYKKVRSAKGQNLKQEIHILFKLKGNRISEFRVLHSSTQVPKPRPRPKDYDITHTKSKVYSNDLKVMEGLPQDRLPSLSPKVNILLGVCGLAVTVSGLAFASLPLMGAGLVCCVLGVAHIVFQFSRQTQHAIMVYNKGVRLFNKERYQEAERQFKMAVAIDPNNEVAEYALNKVSFYI